MKTVTAALLIPASFVWSLSARAAAESTPDVSPSATPAPPPATPAPLVEPLRAPSAGTKARIEVREIFWGSRYGVHHQPVAFQNDRPLEGLDLYRALGRPELVEQYESRAHLRVGLVAAGGAAMVLGFVVATLNRPQSVCMDVPPNPAFPLPSTECHTDWHSGDTALGLASVSAGVVAIGFGAAGVPDPLDSDQLRAAIDEYNQGLPRPDNGGKVGAAGAPKQTLAMTVSPSLLGEGGGVEVLGRF